MILPTDGVLRSPKVALGTPPSGTNDRHARAAALGLPAGMCARETGSGGPLQNS